MENRSVPKSLNRPDGESPEGELRPSIAPRVIAFQAGSMKRVAHREAFRPLKDKEPIRLQDRLQQPNRQSGVVVRGIHEHQVKTLLHPGEKTALFHRGSGLQMAVARAAHRRDIAPQELNGLASRFDKGHRNRPARERLQAHRAGPGIEVQKPAARDSILKDAADRLPRHAGRRANPII